MFHITQGKGFRIGFDNGYGVSVQFGPGNYCDNYNARIGEDEVQCGQNGSSTAECAVFNSEGKLISTPFFANDTVRGYMSPSEVVALITWVALLEKKMHN